MTEHPKERWKFLLCLRVLQLFGILTTTLIFGTTLTLRDYILNSGRPSYEVVSSQVTTVGGKVFVLNVTSQVWRGFEWKHKVLVYIPRRLAYRTHALLIINGSAPRELTGVVNQFASIAELVGAPVVSLWDVPNQPLFGLREDALIAFTFHQFVQTGEPDWPLLLPMTKSAVATIDCALELFRSNGVRVEKFLVTGGSKRGWTSYLTAAVDDRVCGIVPIVYDNLNMPEQMRRQLTYYGGFSEQLRDYSRYSFTHAAAVNQNGRYETLLRLVDPYFYEINVPIAIIIGTNDPYWVVDSSEVYFENLKSPKLIRAFPNEGHDIRNVQEVVNTVRAFLHFCAHNTFPDVSWALEGSELVVRSSDELESARAWYATSETLDFRRSVWTRHELEVQAHGGMHFAKFDVSEISAPLRNLAVLIEFQVVKDGLVATFTTTPKVFVRGATD